MEGILHGMMSDIKEKSRKRAISRSKGYDKKIFHVTELVYCRRKMMLKREHPELQADISVKPQVFSGTVFEKGLQRYVYDYFKDKDLMPRFSFKGRKVVKDYTVVGEADIALVNKDDLKIDTIIEVKNRMFSNQYTDYYVLQLLLYKWLFNARKAYLWCFSHTQKPKEWFIDDKDIIDDDVISLIENEKNPMWKWECDYCEFRNFCPYYNNGGD